MCISDFGSLKADESLSPQDAFVDHQNPLACTKVVEVLAILRSTVHCMGLFFFHRLCTWKIM